MMTTLKKRLMSGITALVFVTAGVGAPAVGETGLDVDILATAANIVDSGTCGDNVTWALDTEGTLTISGTGKMKVFGEYSSPWYNNQNIKSIIISNGVTNIGNYSFSNCYSLASINIPNTVTSIGYSSFSSCKKLTDVNIPDSVSFIGARAFWGCESLTSISIPNSVLEIAYYGVSDGAFEFCSNLSCINVSDENPNYASIDGVLYNKSLTELIKCPQKKDSVIIPNSVKTIISNSFRSCANLSSVTLPNSVTSIGSSAFHDCISLERIDIPKTVINIGDFAFYGCKTLENISLPEGITNIHSYTFTDCSSIKTIKIPKSVICIESGGFKNCASLESIDIPDSVISIGQETFQGCTGLKNLTLPLNVNISMTEAFKDCTSLESITIPNSVTSIGEDAFWGCTSLANITIPNSVTSIGEDAFWGCTSLANITIPNSVVSIGNRAFYNCTSLESITIPNSVTSFDNLVFYNCTSLASVTIGKSVMSIGSKVFYNCTNLASITIPNSVTSIGGSAFYHCKSLTSINIPNSVTSIGGEAFCGCENLASITMPNSVTSIGYDAFNSCKMLASVNIPNGVISIESGTFSGCRSLRSITIPNSVTSIGGGIYTSSGAFSYCTSLTSITIPDSVTSIGGYAFYNCTNLSSITIPNSVTSIGNNAFRFCANLTNITIPDSVTIIPSSAFSGCTSLKNITIPNSITSIDYNAFGSCTSFVSISIPNSVMSIGKNAFSGCTNLSSITIPDSVISIGDYAFRDCTNLSSITIPSSVTSIGNNAFGYYTTTFYGDKKLDGFIIFCYKDSAGEKYAIDNGFEYYLLDGNENPIDNYTEVGANAIGAVIGKTKSVSFNYSIKDQSNADEELNGIHFSYDPVNFTITSNYIKSSDKKNALIMLDITPKKVGSYTISALSDTNAKVKDIQINVEPELILPGATTGNMYNRYANLTVNCDGSDEVVSKDVIFNVAIDEPNASYLESFLKSIEVSFIETSLGIIPVENETSYKISDDGKSAEYIVTVSCGGSETDITNYISVKSTAQEKILEVRRNPYINYMIFTPTRNKTNVDIHTKALSVNVLYPHSLQLGNSGMVHIFAEKNNKIKEFSYDINSSKVCLNDNLSSVSNLSQAISYSLRINDAYLFLEPATKYTITFDKGTVLLDGKAFEPLSDKGFWTFETEAIHNSPDLNISEISISLDDVWGFSNDTMAYKLKNESFEKKYFDKWFGHVLGEIMYEAKGGKECGTNGVCAGMVIAAISSVRYDSPNPETFIKSNGVNANNLRQINPEDMCILGYSAEEIIKYAYTYQFVPYVFVFEKNWTKNKYDMLYDAVKESVTNNGLPISIGITGNNEAHELLAVGLGINNNEQADIIVYDCNCPYEFQTLTLNKLNNHFSSWEYKIMNWGTDYNNGDISYTTPGSNFAKDMFSPYETFNLSSYRLLKSTQNDLRLTMDGITGSINDFQNVAEIKVSDILDTYSHSQSHLYWIEETDDIIVHNTDKTNDLLLANSNDMIKANVAPYSIVTFNVKDEKESYAIIESKRSDGFSLSFTRYNDDGTKKEITLSGISDDTITATNHDGYVEVKGAKEFDIVTTDNDKVVDTKHIVADDHGVKVEINDDATIKNTTIDTNDDGQYDNRDSSNFITVTPKFDGKETKTYTDITLTAGGKTFTADSTGKITITGLANGTYEAVVSKPTYAPRKITITVGAANDDVIICKYGDVTGNGEIDNEDIARMQQKISQWNVNYVYDETADLNCDGEMDTEDLARLQQYISGWNVKLGKAS